MEPPAVGAVVLVRFPFSDLSQAKLRPAIVLADAGRGDYVLCQVTSNPYADELALEVSDRDFATGSLQRVSYARPAKLFTANVSLLVTSVGVLKPDTLGKLVERVVRLFQRGLGG